MGKAGSKLSASPQEKKLLPDCNELLEKLRAKSVTRISGVHDITVLNHLQRSIFLIGERHNREGSCEDDASTIQANEFVESILKDKNRQLDFFLEAEISLRERREERDVEKQNRNDLEGIRELARSMLAKGELPKTSRVHFVDVRDALGAPQYYTVHNFDSGISGYMNKILFQEQMVRDRETRRLSIETLNDLFFEMIFKTVLMRTSDGKQTSFLRHSLIGKELADSDLVLDDNIEDFLIMEENWRFLSSKFVEEDYGDDIQAYYTAMGDASTVLHEMWAWIHDMYTLARMFRRFTSTASCIVFYGGSAHCQKMREYLTSKGASVEVELKAPESRWSCLELN